MLALSVLYANFDLTTVQPSSSGRLSYLVSLNPRSLATTCHIYNAIFCFSSLTIVLMLVFSFLFDQILDDGLSCRWGIPHDLCIGSPSVAWVILTLAPIGFGLSTVWISFVSISFYCVEDFQRIRLEKSKWVFNTFFFLLSTRLALLSSSASYSFFSCSFFFSFPLDLGHWKSLLNSPGITSKSFL